MKKLYGGFLLAVLSLGVQAGEVTFNGKGISERAPEWISVQLVVQSECFKTPTQAQNENDLKVLAIQKFLSGLKYESEHDSVCTRGGATKPFSRERGYGDNQVIECKGTFQKTTYITFTTADIPKFSAKFLSLQEEVLNSYSSQGEGDAPRSYATISEPSAGVSDKLRKEMEFEAIALAQADARAKFDVLAHECQIEGPVSITHRTQKDSHDPYDSQESYSPKSASFRMGREAVSLDFGPIKESFMLPVTFNYASPTFSVCKLPKK